MKQEISNRNLFGLGVAVAVLSVLLGTVLWKWQGNLQSRGASEQRPLEGLETFGAILPFSLTDKDGRPVTLSNLEGKVSIVNFIYTNCPDTCPIQSAQMRQIQEDFKNERDLRLVSITVDPTRDTPEVLSDYAKRFGADPERWWFLTGEKEAIHKLARKGFRLAAAGIPKARRPESGATHSPRFVLIDRKAQIRGYYISTDSDALERLQQDLKIFLTDET
ncbi:MAG TPA: SCO family protein [Candidatus Binatia bacterium]|nr:SCO family protein [Candidatus Binatia bacterium]